MEQAHVLTGVLRDGRLVTLDESLPLSGRVRVTIEPVDRSQPARTPGETLDAIWARQQARGRRPPCVETVAAELAAERAAWD
jgi:hypothetical protein